VLADVVEEHVDRQLVAALVAIDSFLIRLCAFRAENRWWFTIKSLDSHLSAQFSVRAVVCTGLCKVFLVGHKHVDVSEESVSQQRKFKLVAREMRLAPLEAPFYAVENLRSRKRVRQSTDVVSCDAEDLEKGDSRQNDHERTQNCDVSSTLTSIKDYLDQLQREHEHKRHRAR